MRTIAMTAIAAGWLVAGCTLENMARTGSSTTANPPRRVRFAAAERDLDREARAWVQSNTDEKLIRTWLLTDTWNNTTNNGLSVNVLVYTQGPARGIVKPAAGETSVCYQYPCELFKATRVSKAHMQCNAPTLIKVTCRSVHALR